jgi:hypothetical protein
MKAAVQLQLGLLPHDHFGPDRNAAIKVGDVGIDQAEAVPSRVWLELRVA